MRRKDLEPGVHYAVWEDLSPNWRRWCPDQRPARMEYVGEWIVEVERWTGNWSRRFEKVNVNGLRFKVIEHGHRYSRFPLKEEVGHLYWMPTGAPVDEPWEYYAARQAKKEAWEREQEDKAMSAMDVIYQWLAEHDLDESIEGVDLDIRKGKPARLLLGVEALRGMLVDDPALNDFDDDGPI